MFHNLFIHHLLELAEVPPVALENLALIRIVNIALSIAHKPGNGVSEDLIGDDERSAHQFVIRVVHETCGNFGHVFF